LYIKKDYFMQHDKIAIVGLGYVGLPLARLFATQYNVVGFDTNTRRIDELKKGIDSTNEIETNLLQNVLKTDNKNEVGLYLSSNIADIASCNIYIVTVPTPIDQFDKPDLAPLITATKMVCSVLKKGDTVIYESTVYPGVTEEECVPVLERLTGLRLNIDFFVGYSPERINPGDKERTVEHILKITSGSTPAVAQKIDALYASVITAGTYLAPNIKVAEAAKIVENAQRDINIAFVNELAKIFNVLEIDTHDVLNAAATKWNFIPYKPGLVGGHCIGVDPFYLAEKVKIHGYYPELILSGRRMNDSMGGFVAEQIVKAMIKNDIKIKHSKILLLGFTFKEDCPDIRNTKIIDVYSCLKDYDCNVTIYDPIAPSEQAAQTYNVNILSESQHLEQYNAIVLCVAHSIFANLDLDILKLPQSIVYDIKGVLGTKADYRL
jgi:UDP-N-acetyl-D-galactosamine dehydrogenase